MIRWTALPQKSPTSLKTRKTFPTAKFFAWKRRTYPVVSYRFGCQWSGSADASAPCHFSGLPLCTNAIQCNWMDVCYLWHVFYHPYLKDLAPKPLFVLKNNSSGARGWIYYRRRSLRRLAQRMCSLTDSSMPELIYLFSWDTPRHKEIILTPLAPAVCWNNKDPEKSGDIYLHGGSLKGQHCRQELAEELHISIPTKGCRYYIAVICIYHYNKLTSL